MCSIAVLISANCLEIGGGAYSQLGATSGAMQWPEIQTLPLLEIAIHDVGVDVSLHGMLECSGKASDNFKSEGLPQTHGALVGADDEIELHRAKSALSRSAQRMRAHRAGHAAARRRHGCHVAAVGDVRSATLLVRLQAVRANELAIIFRDKNFALGRKPVRQRAFLVHVGWQGVGLARPDDGLHDRPDGVRVSLSRSSSQKPLLEDFGSN